LPTPVGSQDHRIRGTHADRAERMHREQEAQLLQACLLSDDEALQGRQDVRGS
jgi:hypothetical protein